MEKKKNRDFYSSPTVEIIHLEIPDIVTASSVNSGGNMDDSWDSN